MSALYLRFVLILSAFAAVAARAQAEPAADVRPRVIELYKSGKLFDRTQYKAVRETFADLFEQEHANTLADAYGADCEALTAWLKDRPEVRQTFYNALDARHDKLPQALALFREIWQTFPEQVERYSSLAIATAVVWDDEHRCVYDYTGHQVRTKSVMPTGQLNALDNFRYFIENEKVMEGRTLFLPWEFLIFVVDHRTPLSERLWAQQYYVTTRTRQKGWHQDVPYDHEMLRWEHSKGSQGNRPKLEGQEYTLSNIHQHGGVCAHQADFATRVGKSVGIPAVFCGGKSAYRGLHAWWMFVLVQHVTADKVTFRLISDGRFEGFQKDMFYTGIVVDPHRGVVVLDRDLERRLWVVGSDRAGHRQAELAMRAYPWLCQELGLDTKARAAYLEKCLKVCKYSEPAWTEFARLAKAGAFTEETEQRLVRAQLASVCKTFAAYPDFAWRLFEPMLTVQPDPKEKLKLYEQAVGLFERAQRPDLACDARLKITDLLAAQEKWQTAAGGLLYTIRKFPTEGRYIPRMTQKLQELSGKYKGGTLQLANLYVEMVPAMKTYYRGEGGQYYRAMFDQAVAFLQANQFLQHETILRAKTAGN